MLKFFSNDGLPNKPFVFFVSALVGVVIIGEIVYCGFKFDTGELFHSKSIDEFWIAPAFS